ncbi:MAG: AraC family transcriptional regulator [Butyricicoccaceae bacterium]
MLHRILGLLLLDDTSPAHAGSDRIAEAIRYMNRHLFEELSVQEVAASVSLSSSHFSRQFKAKTGYSPYEYSSSAASTRRSTCLPRPSSRSGDRLCHRLQPRKTSSTASAATSASPRPVPEAPDLTEKEQGVS